MKMRRLCALLLCTLLVCGMALPVSAAPAEAEYSAILPPDWIQESQTERFIDSTLAELEALSVTQITCDIGSYAVLRSSGGRLSVQSGISMKSLPKWIKLAHRRGMTVLVGIRVAFSPEMLDSRNICEAQLLDRIAAGADKVLAEGLRYNGTVYRADGIQFICDAYGADDQEILLDMLTTVSGSADADQIIACAAASGDGWEGETAETIAACCDQIDVIVEPDSPGDAAYAASFARFSDAEDAPVIRVLVDLRALPPALLDCEPFAAAEACGAAWLGVSEACWLALGEYTE